MRPILHIALPLCLAGICLALALHWTTPGDTPPGSPDLNRDADHTAVRTPLFNLNRAIDFYRTANEEKPGQTEPAILLAQLYLQASRLTGRETHFVSLAEGVVNEVGDELNPRVLLTRAAILMSKHRFEQALALAIDVLRHEPNNLQAYGVVVDAQLELGNYQAAVDQCDRMLQLRPDIRSYSRASYLRQIHGLDEAALFAMKLASAAGAPGSENRAWALFQIGDIWLDQGNLGRAEKVFQSILNELPGHTASLAGLAEIKTLQGAPHEAISMLLYAYERAPEIGLLAQLVDAQKKAGLNDEAGVTMGRVKEAFGRLEALGWLVDLEWAEFSAKHGVDLADAQSRAAREFHRRPQNIEVLETYAWVLYRNGHAYRALPLIERAIQVGIRDAELYRRAAQIAGDLGETSKAARYGKTAQEINTGMTAGP